MRIRATILAMAVALAGCDDSSVCPVNTTPPAWEVASLPLAPGTTWDYALSFRVTFTLEDGSPAREPIHRTAGGMREITGTEAIDGREYAVEMFTAVGVEEDPIVWWRRYRQDSEAFYQADVPDNVPPGGVPDTAAVDDRVRLRFPVFEGDSWFPLQDNPGIVITVEGPDTLTLEIGEVPAWRVRVDIESFGPDDTLFLWYGTQGLLRREQHTEFSAIDVSSGQTVHVVSDDVEELTDFRPPAAAAVRSGP